MPPWVETLNELIQKIIRAYLHTKVQLQACTNNFLDMEVLYAKQPTPDQNLWIYMHYSHDQNSSWP